MEQTPGGPASGRRRDAEATRRELLRAAHGRFVRLGYDATTLRDVAADVGVNVALIKRYFGSKEGLFKAAVAATPRFLGGEHEFPGSPAALAESLAHHLSAEAWPEFDDHPVLMLLRAAGDPQVSANRRTALHEVARRILTVYDGAPDDYDDRRMLRAQLVVALGIGVVVARSTVGLQPLSDATAEDLTLPLLDVVDALLTPPSARQRTAPGER